VDGRGSAGSAYCEGSDPRRRVGPIEQNRGVGKMRLLLVRDVAASARFYREAFDVDVHAGQEIALEVEDLDQAHARAVKAGAEVVRRGVYKDPEGNIITLTEQPHALRVAGADMAGGGWAVVALEENRIVDAFRCESFAEALLVDAEVVGVDIPIGIPESSPRPADVEARRFVGARASSVFPTPVRAVLEAPTYADARQIAVELTGKSVSSQSYALRHRILEVDELASRDERVIEVHPEVSFSELARRPLLSKHRTDGLAERRELLVEAGIEVPESVPRISEPDLLDATVVAWSARRYARGEAVPLPEHHEGRIGVIWR
jgi:predicted RNase H-like nuclease